MKKKQKVQVKQSIIFSVLLLFFTLVVGALLLSVNTLNQASTDSRSQAKSVETQMLTVDIPMVPGQNFIALPVSTKVTFQQLCKRYPITTISEKITHDAGSWKDYSCSSADRAGRTFLQERVGYMVRAESAFTMQFKGPAIQDYTYTHVAPDWTSIGVPMASQYNLTAHNLCGPLSGTSVEIVEISAWVNGAWSSHICTLPQVNNYTLSDWSGYLVRSESL